MSSLSFASGSEKLVWSCTANGNSQAFVIRKVENVEEFYRYNSEHVVVINDETILRTLGLQTRPFILGAWVASASWKIIFRDYGLEPENLWTAVKGRSQDGIAFYSDGPGMKIIALDTGSQRKPLFFRNWYFNYGECLKF